MEVNSGFLASVGIGMDIVGALILAWGFMAKSSQQITRESLDYWDGNPFRLRNAHAQVLETRAGFFSLLLGFILQFIANLSFIKEGRNSSPLVSIVIVCIYAGMLQILLIRAKHNGETKSVIKEFKNSFVYGLEEQGLRGKKLRDMTDFAGEAIGMKRRKNEKLDSYVKRLLQKIKASG